MTQLQAHPAAGWYVDPSGRHEARYWDGDRWTDRIADRGVENHDAEAASGDAQRRAPDTATVHVESPPEPVAPEITATPEAVDSQNTAGPVAGDPPIVAAEPEPEPEPSRTGARAGAASPSPN